MQIATTNIALIRHLSFKGILTQYSYFLLFKYKYSNSLYYRFNINRVAKANRISHHCAQKRINGFLQRGWCYIEHGHLKFISLSALCKLEKVDAKTTNLIQIGSTHKELKLSLQAILLDDHVRKQEYVRDLQRDLNNPTNLKSYKSAIRRAKRLGIQPGDNASELITMSVSRMASIYNCSLSAAHRIKRQFQKHRWFDFIKQTERLAENVTKFMFLKFFRPYFDKSVYLYKGIVYKMSASIIMRLRAD
jgi:hypothetical protein